MVVVTMELWPRNDWMYRRSAPPSRRRVANVWRNIWGVTWASSSDFAQLPISRRIDCSDSLSLRRFMSSHSSLAQILSRTAKWALTVAMTSGTQMGMMRSRDPLPMILTVDESRSMSARRRCDSSATRIPVANNSSMIAKFLFASAAFRPDPKRTVLGGVVGRGKHSPHGFQADRPGDRAPDPYPRAKEAHWIGRKDPLTLKETHERSERGDPPSDRSRSVALQACDIGAHGVPSHASCAWLLVAPIHEPDEGFQVQAICLEAVGAEIALVPAMPEECLDLLRQTSGRLSRGFRFHGVLLAPQNEGRRAGSIPAGLRALDVRHLLGPRSVADNHGDGEVGGASQRRTAVPAGARSPGPRRQGRRGRAAPDLQ